jgi:hypothetical protein
MKIKVVLCLVLLVVVDRSICLIQGEHSGDDLVGVVALANGIGDRLE